MQAPQRMQRSMSWKAVPSIEDADLPVTCHVNSGNSGAAVVPGDADASTLIQRLLGNGALMPPGGALADDQIQLLVDWVNAGAAE